MKKAALIAGLLAAIAATDRRAARAAPPAAVSARAAKSAGKTEPAKLRELETILSSRNDNDPRLDLDFNSLTAEDKRLFREKYRAIPAESRNARGTVVYLLGKNLKTREDWAFLREVALEPPCLSLSNCAKRPAPGSDEEATGDEVTLAYPALVALRQARRELEKARAAVPDAGAAEIRKEALALFAAATKSRTRAVSRTAIQLEKKFARP